MQVGIIAAHIEEFVLKDKLVIWRIYQSSVGYFDSVLEKWLSRTEQKTVFTINFL